MSAVVKIDLQGKLARGERIVLDLGCGNAKGATGFGEFSAGHRWVFPV